MKVISSILKKIPESMTSFRGSMLEEMAKRMPKKDADRMMKHWTQPSDASYHQSTINTSITAPISPPTSSPASTTAPPNQTPNETSLSTQTTKSSQWKIPEDISDNHLLHPVMGEKKADLVYKMVYITSVSRLIQAPVWEKQRILRPDRSARIAEYKIKAGSASSIPGVITMYLNKVTNEVGIVDGQHRVGALMLLAEQGHWNPYVRNITVDVFTVESDEDVSALFREINSAEPVRLIDMPGEVSSLLGRSFICRWVECRM
jgi:hypothetical protein